MLMEAQQYQQVHQFHLVVKRLRKTSLQPLTLVDEGFTAVDASVHLLHKNIHFSFLKAFFHITEGGGRTKQSQ